jgi:hypothetical protein
MPELADPRSEDVLRSLMRDVRFRHVSYRRAVAEGFRKLYPGLAKVDATGRLITDGPAGSAQSTGGIVHVHGHERSGPHGVVHVSDYDRSAPAGTASPRPTLNAESDRIRSIVGNTPARFDIADNPNADASDPWYVSHSAGRGNI